MLRAFKLKGRDFLGQALMFQSQLMVFLALIVESWVQDGLGILLLISNDGDARIEVNFHKIW